MTAKAALLFTLLMTALLAASPAWGQTTHEVTVGNSFFSPNDLTIEPGDTVRWTNAAGGPSHDVTADDFSFASVTAPAFTFEMTFNSEGDIPYHCTVHSVPGANRNTNMNGIIRVQSSGGGEADLSVVSVDASPGTYEPGDPIAIDIVIQNVGDASSGGYSVSYYASTDATITAGDTSLGSDNRGALGANAMDSFAANAAFPGGIADGAYFIGAIIDTADANAGNNTGVDNATVTVSASQAEPDLALTEISAPSGSFPQGATITVEAEVENVGDAASDGFTIDFYASTNTDISTQDRLLGSQNRGGLAPGEDSSASVELTIPGNLAPGNYFIGGIIDVNDVNDANDRNFDDEALTVTEAGGGGFLINEGLNDSWFNPETGGQGFFITVFPDIQKIFLAWFTYELERPDGSITAMLGEPGHRWLTAFGDYSGDTAVLDIEITQGGVFDAPEPQPSQSLDGTITVTFTDCSSGVVEYDITSVGRTGSVPIQRLANDNIPFCESLATP